VPCLEHHDRDCGRACQTFESEQPTLGLFPFVDPQLLAIYCLDSDIEFAQSFSEIVQCVKLILSYFVTNTEYMQDRSEDPGRAAPPATSPRDAAAR
jgi:hypothetical protein